MMNRRILVSLMVIGAIAAIASGTTLAVFNDTETSEDNTFQAGSLDMQVAWEYTYDGASEVDYISYPDGETGIPDGGMEPSYVDQPGAVFNFDDIKPGDSSEGQFNFKLTDNPGYVYAYVDVLADNENTVTEPEANSPNENNGQSSTPLNSADGELPENMQWTIYEDTNNNGVYDSGTDTEIDSGNANDISGQNYVQLTGDLTSGAFSPDTEHSVNFHWEVPITTGNEIQTDSVEMAFGLYTEQERNNDGNTPQGITLVGN